MSPSPSPPLRCAAVRGSVSSSRQRSDEQPSPHRRPSPSSTTPPWSIINPPRRDSPGQPRIRTSSPLRKFLLAEPDAYLYRRRYLELITHTPGPDGTTITDYTAAEKYLLTTAARRRKALLRPTALYAVQTTVPEGDVRRPDLGRYNRLTKCTTESGTAGISNPAPTDAARAPTLA